MNKLKSQLIRDEGFSGKPYRDTVGKLTIGYGRNLDDVGISRLEADLMLEHDIKTVMDKLEKYDWYREQNQARQRALINMAFNMGVAGLLGFKKMIAALRFGNYKEAAKQILDSKYAYQVGVRALRIAEIIKKGTDE